jgi:hypothetical protein
VEGTLESVATHLDRGDARAALVAAITPDVLVAAYTDELDCVAMLRFPQELVDIYDLEVGTRLITQFLSEDRLRNRSRPDTRA